MAKKRKVKVKGRRGRWMVYVDGHPIVTQAYWKRKDAAIRVAKNLAKTFDWKYVGVEET